MYSLIAVYFVFLSTVVGPEPAKQVATQGSAFQGSAVPAADAPQLSFDRFDRDGNGVISGDEMPSANGPVRVILKSRDTNGDGIVDANEFYRGGEPEIIPSLPSLGAGQQRSLFDRFDTNKDGKVVREEIPEAVRARFERLFNESGKDALTREDFVRPPSARKPQITFLDLLDADKDGLVSRNEINKAADDPMALQLSGLETGPLFAALKATDQPFFTEEQLVRLLYPVVKRSQDQAKRRQTFNNLDVNQDGRISVAEAPREIRPALEQFLSRANLPLGTQLTLEQFEKLYQVSQPEPAPAVASSLRTQIPAAFQVLDANRDGVIVPGELTDIVEKLGRLDRNRDNELSLDEFMGSFPGAPPIAEQAAPPTRERPQPDPVPDAGDTFVANFFAQFDRDSNGKLTTAEVPEQVSAKFGKLDIDGDGAVSRAELKEGVIQNSK